MYFLNKILYIKYKNWDATKARPSNKKFSREKAEKDYLNMTVQFYCPVIAD